MLPRISCQMPRLSPLTRLKCPTPAKTRSHPSRVGNPNRAIAGSAIAKIPRMMNKTATAISLRPAFFMLEAVPRNCEIETALAINHLRADQLGSQTSRGTLRLGMTDRVRFHIPSKTEDSKEQDSVPVRVEFVPCHAMTS